MIEGFRRWATRSKQLGYLAAIDQVPTEAGLVREEYKHAEITGRIIGAAMQVHSTLGNGFQEVIYQRAMAIEMAKRGLSFQREMEMSIFYDRQDIGTRRVDFLVESKVMVELKALTKMEDVHLAQAINYLEAYQLDVGLLLNFGSNRACPACSGTPPRMKMPSHRPAKDAS